MEQYTGGAPRAIFYSNGSAESQKAREILTESGLPFEEIDAHSYENDSIYGYQAPMVRAREGEFEGVRRIREFISYVGDSS